MLKRAQRLNRARGLRITLPSMMSLVAHPVGQGSSKMGRRLNQPVQALGNASVLLEGTMPSVLPVGMMPPMLLVHPAFGTRPRLFMSPATLIRRPDDMLSSPLGQHILDYEPPRGFIILDFSTFNGSTDPYDHMLHYN